MSSNPLDRRLVALLREIAELSQEASLTGSLEGGATQAATRYNALLRTFVAQGQVPEGLFEPLDQSADFSRIGVESRLLASFLEDQNGNGHGNKSKSFGVDASFLVRLAPFVDGDDLADLVKDYMKRGSRVDQGVLTSLAPFLDKDSLGQLLKSHLRSSLNDEPLEEEQPRPGPVPSAPTPPRDFSLAVKPDISFAEHREGATLEELATLLKDPNLSSERRQEIAIRLAEIAHEQANRE